MKNILLQIDETQIVHNTSKWFDFFEAKALEYGPKILIAIIIYLVGTWLIKWSVKLITRFFSYRKFDDTLKSFLLSMVKVGLTVLLFLTIAGQIGIPITGFAAILGGLAIGVGAALNGSLGNLAGGVMLMIFKPFKVGDIITAQGMTGTVTEIGIVNTVLRTPENKTVFLPNGALSTGVITNFNEYGNLKVSIELAIDASENIEKARRIGVEVMQSFPEVMQDPKPSVVVSKIEGGAIYLGFAPYATQGDYWKVYWGVLEKLKVEFDKNGINLPISSMVVKNA
ncbi:mechanosensitive ion channel family protein [Rhizosphaericola mali]|uniref:Mechanosensitive ion channel n=1 Tax=Rhizosphaericola mali TaxID=2545455 RepID=A0A5P2FW73_9BACT|nr:mechanosensitive ion channel domain-containing protein [Rhizosphaericola mali]QES87774.1 mechanosensitive ion channel [Rhizosphaericola mali]